MTAGEVTQSPASWMSGGSWGSSASHCSAGTLGGKGLCPLTAPVLPPGASASPSYPLLCRAWKVSREEDGPQARACNPASPPPGLEGVRVRGSECHTSGGLSEFSLGKMIVRMAASWAAGRIQCVNI